MAEKKTVMVSFPGAALELRNEFEYPEKDPVTRQPTGKTKVATCGKFLHIAGGKSIDVTGLDLQALAQADKDLRAKPAAKAILQEIAEKR